MDLHDYIAALRQRWLFVTVCVLLGLAGALTVTALMPRTYTATAQLFIATGDKDSANAYQGGLFTQQRVKSYTRIVSSPAVLDRVINELDLHTTPGRLARKISAQAPLDTTLINIRVNDSSAARAQSIADETAAQFTKYIVAVEGSAIGTQPLVKASVVGGAQPPSTPTSPRPALNVAIGLLVGGVVGVGGAVLRRALDTTIRSADDVSSHLNLTTVGAVPPPDRRHKNSGSRAGATWRAEALSLLRTRLRFSDGDRMPNSLLISSALPGEGRTQTAIDLATNVARTGQRVILLEADLRRPRLAKDLGLHGTPGLTGVLTGRTPLYDALESWGDGHIRVLPSGPATADPSTLLSSPDMAQVVHALEADADLVVVDSPPLLPFADAAALASVTEGVLFVVLTGKTHHDVALRALGSLSAVHARVRGAVLTGARAEASADWQPPGEPDRPEHVRASDRERWAAEAAGPAPGWRHE
ncbi:polysaccharide biosynthesis tyrosine autokinase [Streptomyces neyagawaensis]|uniref:polysaccharide biosynthesis tyrosine autokinase n=1 Tax=Streptomyces neyagawaensis TaxID=42238 RepID=UPI0006E45849|nr:polysaccharide biosynthesis tyrosine autokinase [Streptomyces neyagawaensis]MCL6738327.1 Wzz/FepE/Etk N-terminal domain-containing protein [Streptomyces neyagawaensis]MDE1688164.1 Wzz/FepE/Etk N-terminal domain-containing protein [Streptomyces neyagawaensis]